MTAEIRGLRSWMNVGSIFSPGLLYCSCPEGGGNETRRIQPPNESYEEEESKKEGRRRRSAANINNDFTKMSIVFVPKKLRGKAKINQETIQRVSRL